MHIDRIRINDYRNFIKFNTRFVHKDMEERLGFPKPQVNNVNLVLGNNGHGKTSLLRAIALAALGPVAARANFPVYKSIRQSALSKSGPPRAEVSARFSVNDGRYSTSDLVAKQTIVRKGDLEYIQDFELESIEWNEIYEESSSKFFVVGYGATRRADQ